MNSSFYWDTNLFLALNRHAGTWMDYLLGWPTYLGEAYLFLPVTFLLLLIWDPKNTLSHFLKIVVCILFASLANSPLKDLVDRPRPWSFFYQAIDQELVDVTFLFSIETSKSFPSGHTAAVFSLATALVNIYGRKLLWIYLFALWIGVSRVFCGAHFPLDIFGGALVGFVSAQFACWIINRPTRKKLSQTTN